MAGKKNSTTPQIDNTKDEFDDTISDVEDIETPESDEEVDPINDISDILANPDKALNIKPEESDETEEVLYCPNCGVTGLFVDNVCMNCGEKKSKKSYSNSDDSAEDLMDFGVEDSINLDDF